MRFFILGLGIVRELAFISIFAFPASKIEARLFTKKIRSGIFRLDQLGSTHTLASAISVGKD